jgi:hypothetical protein
MLKKYVFVFERMKAKLLKTTARFQSLETVLGLVILAGIAGILMSSILIAITDSISSQRNVENFDFLTDPQLKRGDRIYVRTANEEYVSVCEECEPTNQNLINRCKKSLCLKINPTRSSVFIYEPFDDGTFSLKTWEGLYLKRCSNCFESCPNIICADGVNPKLQTSKFTLIKHGNAQKSISIKADTGRLLEINECDQNCGRVIAALGVGLNTEFRIEKLPPIPISIKIERKQTMKFLVPSYAPITIPWSR